MRLLVCVIALLICVCSASAGNLPERFTYLRNVDASIAQDIRYAGTNNFTGEPVDGYNAHECVLTKATAKALRLAQSIVKAKNLSLRVYDCYRPVRSVRAFVSWVKKPEDGKTRSQYYPDLKRSSLIALGYIADRSAHSEGCAVDVTLQPAALGSPPGQSGGKRCGEGSSASNDASVDMGTGFDCFSPLSSGTNTDVSSKAQKNRTILLKAMRQAGFSSYSREWWHFVLKEACRGADDFTVEPLK